MLLAWLALHWSILPHIDRWRPLVEARTSQALGVPVRIGSISAQSSGWGSTLELRDVKLLDAQLRPALELPRVVASLSLRSLVGSLASMELHLAQLLIDGAQVEARRDTAGRLFIAGIDFSAGSGEGGSDAADWFFKQGEFVIRGGSLRWTDEQRGAPPLALDGVDIVVRNTLRRHALRLDATPPPDWGDRFTLRGEFKAAAARAQLATGDTGRARPTPSSRAPMPASCASTSTCPSNSARASARCAHGSRSATAPPAASPPISRCAPSRCAWAPVWSRWSSSRCRGA